VQTSTNQAWAAAFLLERKGSSYKSWRTQFDGIKWFAWDVFEIGTLSCALAKWKMYRNEQSVLNKGFALFILIAGTPLKTTTAPEENCASSLSSPR
jgi:hypothetical protein